METLQEILPRENRTRDAEINPEDNFLIEGKSNDGSKITAILYREINEQETLISVTSIYVSFSEIIRYLISYRINKVSFIFFKY